MVNYGSARLALQLTVASALAKNSRSHQHTTLGQSMRPWALRSGQIVCEYDALIIRWEAAHSGSWQLCFSS